MRWIFPYRTIGLLRLERPFEIIKSSLRTDHVGSFGVLVAWLFSRQILKHHFNPRWCSLLPGLPLGLQDCHRGGEEPGCSVHPQIRCLQVVLVISPSFPLLATPALAHIWLTISQKLEFCLGKEGFGA